MNTFKWVRGPSHQLNKHVDVHAAYLREVMPPGIIHRKNGTTSFLFMYLYDPVVLNEGETIVNDRHGFLKIWKPWNLNYFGNPARDWRHSTLACHSRLIASMLKANKLPVNEIIPLPDPSIVEKYLLAFYNELTAFRKEDPVIIDNLFHNFIRELARQIHGEEKGLLIKPEIQKVKSFVEANYTNTIMLADLARMANMSESHFRSEYHKYIGLSPMEHVIELRMQEAALMLTNQNVRIREVAASVGYDDIYYFSKRFSHRFGASPRAYRKKLDSSGAK